MKNHQQTPTNRLKSLITAVTTAVLVYIKIDKQNNSSRTVCTSRSSEEDVNCSGDHFK